jgi:uncharacterized membrane protein
MVRSDNRRPALAAAPTIFSEAHTASRLRTFLGDGTGAVTIEITTLVPFFVMLLVFFADASVIYLTRSEMYYAARDIARGMSVDTITTQQEAEAYAARHLFLGSRSYDVHANFGADMSATISIPVGEAAVFGFFLTQIIGRELSASATARREPLR